MYVLVFYVPGSHLEAVKSAVFAAGAGAMGNYKECSWETAGTGQFVPLPFSSPFIGKENICEKTEEYRVETICVSRKTAVKAVKAMLSSHPYETPAWHVYKTEDIL